MGIFLTQIRKLRSEFRGITSPMNKKHFYTVLEQMFCKNISSCLLLKTIQEHFAVEITFTNLAGKVLCCKLHTDTTHSSVTPACKPLGHTGCLH